MRIQQSETSQPSFGTRVYVPQKTHRKLLSNVEKFVAENKFLNKEAIKKQVLNDAGDFYEAVFEHNANPANHLTDNSTVKINNIEFGKRCQANVYKLVTKSGDRFHMEPGKKEGLQSLQKIQDKMIEIQNLTAEQRAEKILARTQRPNQLGTPSFWQRVCSVFNPEYKF